MDLKYRLTDVIGYVSKCGIRHDPHEISFLDKFFRNKRSSVTKDLSSEDLLEISLHTQVQFFQMISDLRPISNGNSPEHSTPLPSYSSPHQEDVFAGFPQTSAPPPLPPNPPPLPPPLPTTPDFSTQLYGGEVTSISPPNSPPITWPEVSRP